MLHRPTLAVALTTVASLGLSGAICSAALAAYVERAPIAPGGGVPAEYVTPTPRADPNDPQTPTILRPAPPQATGYAAAAQSRYVFANPDGPTSLLRNTVAGYVIGSALNGWTFDVANRCTPSACGIWYRGTIYGNHDDCGFAQASRLDQNAGTPHSLCDPHWLASPTRFGLAFNCSDCTGPRAVRLTAAANRFLNVKALNGGNGPATESQGPLPAGTCVEWRYITRNGYFVLAKWRGVDNNHGSWAFMERSSFPASLPTGQVRCPAG